MFIQPQQGQIIDKLQQNLVEKRRPKRKPFGNERRTEFEYSKVAEDLERDVLRLQEDIGRLLAKVTKKRKVNKTIQITPPSQSPTIVRRRSTDFLLNIIKNILSYILIPFHMALAIPKKLYRSINCTVILILILLIECFIIFLVWTAKRSFHAYSYVESYEPAVHGTFGVDQTTSFGIINSIQDFFADLLIGHRRFGVSSYEELVPV
ncbi:14154_t:CDS:2 [Cetraspora pellucida]|uniref:14154_t:CDS:1 n=1 Tax=Cetraspora pellucida TaxID=1433469 RepID=A0A9N9ICP9_9GLOM|nr:14154_t:CDS:2 [Cetraspora pellucida]